MEASIGIFLWLVELVNISHFHELTEFFTTQDQTIKNVMSIVGVIVLIIGLLQCFLGFRLFKIWCGIIGFVIGVLFAVALATSGILHDSPSADLISLLLILILGFIGSLIAYKVYLVGLFIYAFSAVFIIGFILAATVTGSFLACLVTGIIMGTAMGVLVVIFRRFWIILMTSVHGAMSVCVSLMMIMQNMQLGFAFALPPVLGIAGFCVQYFFDKKAVEKIPAGKISKPAAEAETVPVEPDPQNTEPDVPVETEPAVQTDIPLPAENGEQENLPELDQQTPPAEATTHTEAAPPADAAPGAD